jgi:hypothetical protein
VGERVGDEASQVGRSGWNQTVTALFRSAGIMSFLLEKPGVSIGPSEPQLVVLLRSAANT